MNHTLTAITGLKVGHYTNLEAATGCTVILCPPNTVAGVDVRGSAPGTRETDLLSPLAMVPAVHAILLTGGSAFGLDAAGGVMRRLEEEGIGFDVGVGVVPIVPAAVLFDLTIGRADVRPGPAEGYAACLAASAEPVTEGNVGAGTGATVGKLLGPGQATKSGTGSACRHLPGGITVAALVAVNAFGDVVDPANGTVIAGPRRPDGNGFVDTLAQLQNLPPAGPPDFAQNTTLAVVATNAILSKPAAGKVAQMAHDGLALTIRPIHTMADGDTVFALATGTAGVPADTSLIGAVAAATLAEAVLRAIRSGTDLAGIPAAQAIV